MRSNTNGMDRWEGVFFKTGLSLCNPQFIPWPVNILPNPSKASFFTDFTTCTPNTLQMSSTLLLSLAFLLFSTGRIDDHHLAQWWKKIWNMFELTSVSKTYKCNTAWILHLLQGMLRTNEILIGWEIIVGLKPIARMMHLTTNYLLSSLPGQC